jgi:hypothetical protein
MKKVLFVLMALCLVSTLAFAAESATTADTTTSATTMAETAAPATTTAAATVAVAVPVVETAPAAAAVPEKVVVLKGDVIDNMCASAHKDALAEFVKTHTKECAIAPGCIESGYSLFADGKLYAFSKDSSAKVAEFVKKADSKLQVVITAKQVGDELSLVSIENQN